MGMLRQLVSRFSGGGATRSRTGGPGVGAHGGAQSSDAAIGRGVRRIFGRFR